jgi:hypothetical protein
MWQSEQHSDDENLRWAWLRASEWHGWPQFISQPIAPILLYFYPWQWVIVSVAFATFVWWFIVAPRFTPTTVADLPVYFVGLRFLTSPLMAFLIWQEGGRWTATLALLWPLLGSWLVMCLLVFPQAALSFTARAKAAQIGVVQQRLMHRLGYSRIPEIGYMRGNTDTAIPEFEADSR